MNIAVITLKSNDKIKTLETLSCSQPHNLVFCRSLGYGKARNDAAKTFGSTGLMIQLNDDLVLSPKLWSFALKIKRGEFGFQIVNEWVCSRVFIIHLEDYWKIGGCDNTIKYAFEDGDFYLRAIKKGLIFHSIPTELAQHIPHKHAFTYMKNIAKIDYEWTKLFVKYKRNVQHNMFRFFINPFDYRVLFQHFVLKVTFVIYWLIHGVN